MRVKVAQEMFVPDMGVLLTRVSPLATPIKVHTGGDSRRLPRSSTPKQSSCSTEDHGITFAFLMRSKAIVQASFVRISSV